MKRLAPRKAVTAVLATIVTLNASAFAADARTATPTPSLNPPSLNPSQQSDGTKLPIDRVKERYWDKGREAELRVVQNRLYSKAQKFELGILGGWISSDPFLSIKNLGLSLGYHFNETFAVTLLGWKAFTSNSSALDYLETSKSVTANTNFQNYFYGAEFDYVPIYGKLSLLGSTIIYFDMHLDLGAGVTNTETGKNFTPFIGVGEQIYITRYCALAVDYRLMVYNEDLKQKTLGQPIGPVVSTRTSWNNVVTLGVNFFGTLF